MNSFVTVFEPAAPMFCGGAVRIRLGHNDFDSQSQGAKRRRNCRRAEMRLGPAHPIRKGRAPNRATRNKRTCGLGIGHSAGATGNCGDGTVTNVISSTRTLR